MSVIHEKKYTAIDAFDTDSWDVIETVNGAIYQVKEGAEPQTITITRPDGGEQIHNGLPPGSRVDVDRVNGTATVTAA